MGLKKIISLKDELIGRGSEEGKYNIIFWSYDSCGDSE